MKTNLPPHLNPLPQGGEETRFHVPPLPRGEGRGEGQITKHLHTAAAFLVITLLLAAGNAACAQPFNNWPTYASAPLTNWPKATEYEQLVEHLTWCHRALTERSLVVNVATSGIAPAVGEVRLPKTDIERMKNQVELLIPEYVDDDQAGSFTNLSEFPMLVETGVMAAASLPADFLDRTPYSRCLGETLLPGVTTNYGMPGLRDSILELEWTGKLCRDANVGNHTANRHGKGGTCPHKHDTWVLARTCIEDQFDDGWQQNMPVGDSVYYQLYRSLSYTPEAWAWGWCAGSMRRKSTPQCPDIIVPEGVSFSWDAYLEPIYVNNDCGVSYDGYSGWVKDKLKKWDSGGATSSNTVQATTIGGEDETFPFYLEPELVGTNRTTHGVQVLVRDFHWLLKWDFQYDE